VFGGQGRGTRGAGLIYRIGKMRVGKYSPPPRPLSLDGKECEMLYSDPRGIWFVVIRWTAHHLVGEAK